MYVFDAGTGNGTVLSNVLRQMHRELPTVPFFVAGKEISMEDARLTLNQLPDRLVEHPDTVFVLTNMFYAEAPWLFPRQPDAQARLKWWDVALDGGSAHEFSQQIEQLDHVLTDGSPIVSRTAAEAKVRTVLAPLARSLAPGGRLVVVQSTGHDPGMEIIRKVWPDEESFATPRQLLIGELDRELNPEAAGGRAPYAFEATSDAGSLFTYHLHAMPNEVPNRISTSTALAAWNAAVHVAQIEDERIASVLSSPSYIDATVEWCANTAACGSRTNPSSSSATVTDCARDCCSRS